MSNLVMSLPLSQPASSTTSSSAPAFDARLLRLHSVFAHLDSISPDHPASQSITLPKLKEALTTYSNHTFTTPTPPTTTAATQPSLLDKRRRRIAEEERVVQDMLDAVDVTRNGRIEFNEFLQMMDSDKTDNTNQQHADDEDDEWTPTKDNVRGVFAEFDKDKDGYISLNELKEMFRTNGIDYYTDDQIQQMALAVDNQALNAKGISLVSFSRLLAQSAVQSS